MKNLENKVITITGTAMGFGLVKFLLGEKASYVNGQTIAIDGGKSNIHGNV